MPDRDETVKRAKDAYLRAKSQLCSAFAVISDEYVNWSPAETARTPAQIVAHCAASVRYIQQQMDGTPFAPATTAEADAMFREWERGFQTRAQALALLEEVSEQYVAWLDALTVERLASVVALPFGLGAIPVEAFLGAAPDHTRGHAAQLEYIQTLTGDRDWHLG